jgi:hypothetical protein
MRRSLKNLLGQVGDELDGARHLSTREPGLTPSTV